MTLKKANEVSALIRRFFASDIEDAAHHMRSTITSNTGMVLIF